MIFRVYSLLPRVLSGNGQSLGQALADRQAIAVPEVVSISATCPQNCPQYTQNDFEGP